MRATGTNDEQESEAIYSYRKLDFWQLARSLSVDVYTLAKRFPRDDATRVVTRQFVASATSIRANIAEGHGRYSKAAYRNHLSIARGSASETEDWVDFLHSVELLSAAEANDLTKKCRRIIAAVTRAMQRLAQSQPSQPRLGEPSMTYGTDAPDEFEEQIDDLDDDALLLDAHMLKGEAP